MSGALRSDGMNIEDEGEADEIRDEYGWAEADDQDFGVLDDGTI